MSPHPPLPVTIIGGWFGFGKTRLVETLLAERPGRVAVIHAGAGPRRTHAWSTTAVEEELVHCSPDRCPCCSVRLDLVIAATDLARRRHRPDHLIIEVGGDADGAAVLQTFLRDPDLRSATEVDAMITVVDAPSIAHLVDGRGDLAVHRQLREQIALADRLVVNRTDLTTDRASEQLMWTLHYANPRARAIKSGGPDLGARLLETGSFTREGIVADQCRVATRPVTADGPTVVRLAVTGALDRDALSSWVDDLHHTHGGDLLRIQGVLAVEGDDHRWVARGVRTTLELDDGPPWADGELRASRLWLVGRGLDDAELGSELVSCLSGSA